VRRLARSLPIAVAVAILSAHSALAETVRVFAAASLADAFEEIAALFRERHPGAEVELHFAGSQILRTQIEQGADADVFAPADRVPMEALRSKGLAGPDSAFARNRIVIVTPRRAPKVRGLADLARPGARIVVADPNVPAGRYAAEVLASIGRSGLFGADFEAGAAANVVSRESNVRAVLAKVALDEVDAGFVYATDARAAPEKVLVVEIPDSLNVIAEYPIAVLSKSRARAPAARFVALVLGPEGRAVLAKHGFWPPR
jgi:molybdate transport system substrate-binding protein